MSDSNCKGGAAPPVEPQDGEQAEADPLEASAEPANVLRGLDGATLDGAAALDREALRILASTGC